MWRFPSEKARYAALTEAWVVPKARRCVQCGICSYSCPVSIDVRRHVWLGEPVTDGRCLACGECVKRCPRSLLHFAPIASAPAGDARTGR